MATYADILAEAGEAANAAAQAWLEENTKPRYQVYSGNVPMGTLLDVCGGASLVLKDGRSRFARYVRLTMRDGSNWFHPTGYAYTYRQEMGLHNAAYEAALNVLKAHGVTGVGVHTYID